MKRTLRIVTLLGVLSVSSSAQITSVSGELRYSHHYQDLLGNDRLLTSIRRNPLFNINASGAALSPRFLTFSLRSTINASFNSTQTGLYALDNKQYYWDYYDLDLDLFKYSPVKLNVGARDGIIDSRIQSPDASGYRAALRRQDQRFSVSTNRIRFLPSTSLIYTRAHNWSIVEEPYDQRSEQLSLGMSSSSDNTSLNLNAMVNDLSERYSNFRERYYVVEFDGSKDITEEHRLNVTTEYNRYAGFSTLLASGSFSGPLNERITSYSSIFTRASSSNIYAARSLGGSQSAQYAFDEFFRFGAGLSGRSGSEKYGTGDDARSLSIYDWMLSGSVQHTRPLASVSMSNGVSLSYGQNKYNELRTLTAAALTNSLYSTVGTYTLALNHEMRISELHDGLSRRDFSHNVRLAANGSLPYKIRSQSSLEYREQRYSGTSVFLFDRRLLTARQNVSGSFMAFVPLSAAAGGSVSWYFATENARRSYGWHFSLRSNRFFVEALTMAYTYNRSYDLYYRREVLEHGVEFKYQWRALLFELHMKEYRFFDRRREVLFSVARPFKF